MIWDLNIPQRSDEKEDLAVVIIKAILPDREIETGYGAHWPEKLIDFPYFQNLAEGVGFHTVNLEEKGKTFYLELIKP